MSLFEEMHPAGYIESASSFDDLRKALSDAIAAGRIEEVPVMKKHPMIMIINWYRDKETGEIYSLIPPDFPARGIWEKINIDDLKQSDLQV